MRRLYKNLITATIPFAVAIGGGAAAIGAALQGLVMWFMLAVAIGAGVYVIVVLKLLIALDACERALVRAKERLYRFYPRGMFEFR